MSTTNKITDDYELLAKVLGENPGGFPRTESGVEMKLLRMAFSPEEAFVASNMTRTPETAAEIANRVGLPLDKVTALLKAMLPRRMVRVKSMNMVASEAELAGEDVKYRIGHFLVGWYEGNERTLGREYDILFEQYMVEGGGERILSPQPGNQGVVPYRGSLKPEWIAREPHLDIDAHWERHERFLVVNCMCMELKERVHGYHCDVPVRRCGFVGLPPTTPLSENVVTREEAKKLFDEIESYGTMVHTAFYGFTMSADKPQFVGTCSCCNCCCGIINSAMLAGLKESVMRSNYRAVKEDDKCTNCGECIRRCQFFAHTWKKTEDGRRSVYNRDKCVGCGSCGMGCKSGALHLEPVSEKEWVRVPNNFEEWEEMRLEFLAKEKA
jgi:Na+-translocating ferredoxin:NAD+ oxidoreductase subunit B